MASADHSFTVPADAAGTRLDKWLADAFDGQSRSRLKALITEGAVAVAIEVVDPVEGGSAQTPAEIEDMGDIPIADGFIGPHVVEVGGRGAEPRGFSGGEQNEVGAGVRRA